MTAVARTHAPCGTAAAYQYHLRHSEPVDQACLDANAEQSRRQRAALRMTAIRAATKELRRRHRSEYEALVIAARKALTRPIPEE